MPVSFAVRVLKLAVLISFASLVSGCATQAKLTLISQPEGAYMTEKGTGQSYGIAPVSVVYSPSALEKSKWKDGCYYVKGFEARWVSGVTASPDRIKLCGSPVGHYKFTFTRDAASPGLDKDLQFALQVKATRAQEQEAETVLYSDFLANKSPKLNCTSYQVGNSIGTHCR